MNTLVSQAFRYGAVGIVNTVVGLCVIYALMYFLDVRPSIANGSGYAIGVFVSFLLNRAWTFRSVAPMGAVLPKYVMAAAVCYLFNLGVVVVSIHYLSINAYVAQVLGIGSYLVTFFAICRWGIFFRG